jgi:hypothetical protein
MLVDREDATCLVVRVGPQLVEQEGESVFVVGDKGC